MTTTNQTIDPDTYCREHGCPRSTCDESHPQLLTADTITDDQIRQLRDEAGNADDMEQVKICDVALYGTEDSPSTILSLIDDGHLSTAQVSARARCATAINNGHG